MRRLAFALSFMIVAAACSKKADDTPVDTTPAPPAGPTIDMSAVAGTWDLQVMGMDSDSILTTGVLTATADGSGWVMSLPNRDPMPLTVTIAGDSVITVAPEYESVLRKGVKVQTTGVYRMVGSNFNGLTTARYSGAGADSVAMLRVIGTRKP